MILQALVRHYEDLVARDAIAGPGWSKTKISYALEIDDEGQLLQAVSVMAQQQRGKKTMLLPQEMELPAPVPGRTGKSIKPSFLWDNASYILGIDEKGNPERAKDCFSASQKHHIELLSGVNCAPAQAIVAFFRNWDPKRAADHPALREHLDEILSGANLVFRYRGAFAQQDPAVREAWQRHYDDDSEGALSVCLVTGQAAVPQEVHPSIKGVQGAKPSGAALVSFNAEAFESFGKEQSLNAPVGKYAAFAYTAVLNHLIADHRHNSLVGDTLVLCWAEGGDPAAQDLFSAYAWGNDSDYAEEDIRSAVSALLAGETVDFDAGRIAPDTDFYLLGIAPNAARLSVRFFYRNTIGEFLKNVQAHYDRLRIAGGQTRYLSPWWLLQETVDGKARDKHNKSAANTKPQQETVSEKARDKSGMKNTAAALLRSILTNTPYPSTLLSGVELRIRAEREIKWRKAAILKAYYTKNRHPQVPKEVCTVSLNEQCTNTAYVLGRLFAILERIQSEANPGVNATIKDKYFNSASATPARVFPMLIDLAQKHLRKLAGGQRIYFDKQISGLCSLLQESFPDRMTLPQQGSFQLGYYHQKEKLFEKKEEK